MSSLVGDVQTTPAADISPTDSRQEYSNSINGPPTSINNPDSIDREFEPVSKRTLSNIKKN